MSRQRQAPLDRDKIRAELRRLTNREIWQRLDSAVDLLPPAKLRELLHGYIDLRALTKTTPTKDLVAEVRAFDLKSRGGHYYESFDVNSKNFMESSRGTLAFVADYDRLLDRCIKEASKKTKQAVALEAFEILFSLLRYIEEGHDDVIFLVKEGPLDVLVTDWEPVFTAWFACLSISLIAITCFVITIGCFGPWRSRDRSVATLEVCFELSFSQFFRLSAGRAH